MGMLRPLNEQVIVITGGSSGIGLATARLAAERGASVVIAARNEAALREAAEEIERRGGRALAVATDVADRAQVEALAERAVARFGRIDSWVNDAAVAVYGELARVPIEDQRRLFDVNYWGTVHGSLVALPHLARTSATKRGGALINLGSVLSDSAMPLQGAYTASKHAVKGFTDALRMECRHEGLPVSISLIKPTGIATPYAEHARTYIAHAPKVPPVVYAPEVVARAILHCCETPTRALYVGGAGFALVGLANHAPRLYDAFVARFGYDMQQTDRPATEPASRRDNLEGPKQDGQTRSHTPRYRPRERSLFTEMQMHPMAWGVAGAAAAAALAFIAKPANGRAGTRHAHGARRAGRRLTAASPSPAWAGEGPGITPRRRSGCPSP